MCRNQLTIKSAITPGAEPFPCSVRPCPSMVSASPAAWALARSGSATPMGLQAVVSSLEETERKATNGVASW